MSAPDGETFVERLKRLHPKRDEPQDVILGDPVPHDAPGYDDAAGRYCSVALDKMCAEVATCPEGNRNQTLNDNALRAFRWVLGEHLHKETAGHKLKAAGLEAGLEPVEVTNTLRSAWTGAQKKGPAHPEVRVHPLDGGVVVDEQTGEMMTPEQALAMREAAMLATRILELRVLQNARQILKDEEHAKAFRPPPYRTSLTQELLIPDEEEVYAIEHLLPAGGNALLTAMYKAGKSTLCVNLLRAFADGTPFLGRFKLNPAPGRIAIFNYELSANQFRRWLRDAGIQNTDAVAVLNLRGFNLPITAPAVQDWIVQWLVEQDVSMWIADPFARAAVGTDENSNTEVGVWLDTFDVIKERADVRDGVLPVHTGRAEQEAGQERARGATRLDDWADVRWMLTKNDEGQTFFRATGRDVEQPEEALEYDDTTRTLTMKGGDRAWIARRNLEQQVLQYIVDNPGQGVRAIREGVPHRNVHVDAALASLKRDNYVRIEDVPGKLEPYVATGKRYEL